MRTEKTEQTEMEKPIRRRIGNRKERGGRTGQGADTAKSPNESEEETQQQKRRADQNTHPSDAAVMSRPRTDIA